MKKNNEEKETKKKLVLNKKAIEILILLGIFIIYTILVKLNIFSKLDQLVDSTIIGIRNDKLTSIMEVITNLGGAYFLIATTIIIILIAIIKNRKLPIYTTINLICSFLLSETVKHIVRRHRPTGVFLIKATGFSYPSGHTLVSFAFYTFIAIMLLKRTNNKTNKLLIKILLPIILIAIPFSRIYLGVHYITDIIGGYLLSIIYLKNYLQILYMLLFHHYFYHHLYM